jgi:hypothetical protein
MGGKLAPGGIFFGSEGRGSGSVPPLPGNWSEGDFSFGTGGLGASLTPVPKYG